MRAKRETPISPPGSRREGSAKSGSANTRRQKPVAAGPAAERRTRMGARPMMQAPTTSIVTARARPSDISKFYRGDASIGEDVGAVSVWGTMPRDRGGNDMKHFIGAAAAAVACAVAGAALVQAQTPPPSPCTPAGGLSFVCGIQNGEDLVLVPNTRWLIASGMAPGSGLHAIDTQA